MRPEALFAVDPREPLAGWIGPRAAPAALEDVECRRFEFASRGDRVPGRLLLPEGESGPRPLVLLQHGAGGSKDAPYLDAAAGRWGRGGAAVASIDFPLHGERSSPKLTQRLLGSLPVGEASPEARNLWIAFTRQAVCDLRRALDFLSALPEIDPTRITYASFSLGTILGATFCAVDPRPRAAALAIGGGGFGPPEIDPARWIERVAPRPVLFVNATRDERVPRESTEILFAAAREPKQIEWFECGHSDLPGAALKTMWNFLRAHLGLAAASGPSGAGG
jgi:fermentation-respiration switch protein FrsA (DUF1100 family)